MIPEDELTEIITAKGTSKTSRIMSGVMPYKDGRNRETRYSVTTR